MARSLLIDGFIMLNGFIHPGQITGQRNASCNMAIWGIKASKVAMHLHSSGDNESFCRFGRSSSIDSDWKRWVYSCIFNGYRGSNVSPD